MASNKLTVSNVLELARSIEGGFRLTVEIGVRDCGEIIDSRRWADPDDTDDVDFIDLAAARERVRLDGGDVDLDAYIYGAWDKGGFEELLYNLTLEVRDNKLVAVETTSGRRVEVTS